MKSFPRKYLAISYSSNLSDKRSAKDEVTHLIPQCNITSAIIDDKAELAVIVKVIHQAVHPVYAIDQISDALLVVLLIQVFHTSSMALPRIVGRRTPIVAYWHINTRKGISHDERTWAKEYSW